jgi:WLM domain
VNGGGGKTSEIRLRLRPQHSPDSFLPYEDVLGTMLHEITHNVRGPHDAQFYKILDEVNNERDEFMAKGIAGTGVGFDGPSAGRLGSRGFIPIHDGSEAAMKAAQLKCAPGQCVCSPAASDLVREVPVRRKLIKHGSASGTEYVPYHASQQPVNAASLRAGQRRSASSCRGSCRGRSGWAATASAQRASRRVRQPRRPRSAGRATQSGALLPRLKQERSWTC